MGGSNSVKLFANSRHLLFPLLTAQLELQNLIDAAARGDDELMASMIKWDKVDINAVDWVLINSSVPSPFTY